MKNKNIRKFVACILIFSCVLTESLSVENESLKFQPTKSIINKFEKQSLYNGARRLESRRKYILKAQKALLAQKTKESTWIKNENKRLMAALLKSKYDVLVLPVDIDSFSFNDSEAIIISRYITSFVEKQETKLFLSMF